MSKVSRASKTSQLRDEIIKTKEQIDVIKSSQEDIIISPGPGGGGEGRRVSDLLRGKLKRLEMELKAQEGKTVELEIRPSGSIQVIPNLNEALFEIQEANPLVNTFGWLNDEVRRRGLTTYFDGKELDSRKSATKDFSIRSRITIARKAMKTLLLYDSDYYGSAMGKVDAQILKSVREINRRAREGARKISTQTVFDNIAQMNRRRRRTSDTASRLVEKFQGKLDNRSVRDVTMFGGQGRQLPQPGASETLGQSTESVQEPLPLEERKLVDAADGDTGLLEREGDRIVEDPETKEMINLDEEERKAERVELEQKAAEERDDRLRTTLEQTHTDMSEGEYPKERGEEPLLTGAEPSAGFEILAGGLEDMTQRALDEFVEELKERGSEIGSEIASIASEAGEVIDRAVEDQLGIDPGIRRALTELISGGVAGGLTQSLEDVAEIDPELSQRLGKFVNQVSGVVRIKKQPAGLDKSSRYSNNVSLIQQSIAQYKFDTNIFNTEFS